MQRAFLKSKNPVNFYSLASYVRREHGGRVAIRVETLNARFVNLFPLVSCDGG